jgi:hypothetical protein
VGSEVAGQMTGPGPPNARMDRLSKPYRVDGAGVARPHKKWPRRNGAEVLARAFAWPANTFWRILAAKAWPAPRLGDDSVRPVSG